MSRLWLRHLVPRSWDADQALLAAALLKDALDAVWAVHGERMALHLADVPREPWADVLPDGDTEDDDIPF